MQLEFMTECWRHVLCKDKFSADSDKHLGLIIEPHQSAALLNPEGILVMQSAGNCSRPTAHNAQHSRINHEKHGCTFDFFRRIWFMILLTMGNLADKFMSLLPVFSKRCLCSPRLDPTACAWPSTASSCKDMVSRFRLFCKMQP